MGYSEPSTLKKVKSFVSRLLAQLLSLTPVWGARKEVHLENEHMLSQLGCQMLKLPQKREDLVLQRSFRQTPEISVRAG